MIGFIFLAIVIVSPDGLMGLWDRLWDALAGRSRPPHAETGGREPAAVAAS